MEGENSKRRLPEVLQPVIFGKITDSAVVLLRVFVFFLKLFLPNLESLTVAGLC